MSTEKSEQRRVVDYVKKLGLMIYAIPSVVFNKKTGGVPIGYRKGLPDLCIPKHKLYIEMKNIKPGKVKEHEEIQAKIHEELRQNDCLVFRCEGFEQAKEVIDMTIERGY